ncbi:4-coumarate-CoA ligase [Aspergillus nomiae NRRL 13137]|uniref:4-coumarate-CoA ligase n=1 Tax=Aspergillus nomiae NRRL (strain ATCC 15546 / NRRL 13137 / CBS 260.88 / M93) TaxID=1509407 RepID=A0A0L1JCW3_ASPN3|nr:4-coumarate-CoA ligase [Aspergillus nomiae NRRL 13137]KNG89263.1 4-coumarate-CoA ligase [Aspergillus nomiae NRRL 13137]
MEVRSRWKIEVPNAHLATLVFKSPTHPISKTKPCFIDAARPDTHFLTHDDFRLWSQRFAVGLRKSGIKTGDRILFFSGNNLFFPVVYMGILMAGGVFTGANPAYIPRELAYQLKDSGATYLICAEKSIETGVQAAKMAGLGPHQVFLFNDAFYATKEPVDFSSPDYRYWGELIGEEEEGRRFAWDELSTAELANRTLALNYSSGTTGVPKGVDLSHKNIIANILQYNFLFYLQNDHRERIARGKWLCLLPMYHAMAQNMFMSIALMRGVPVYIMDKYDFVKFLQAIERFRISDLTLVPPIVVSMVKRPETKQHDLSSVETIFCGAAPLGREISEKAEACGRRERTTSIVMAWHPLDWSDSACVGELVPNCEAKVMAEDEVTELGRNQRGELWVRGPNVMKGYWRNPTATRDTLTTDGWLKSGDIGYVDNQGKWYIVDRKKELIKVKGNQVAPAELEALLLEHPAVADVAVIGVPFNDDERPRAYVVLKKEMTATADEIATFINSKVSYIKRVSGGVVFLDAIPKNPSGKILRNVMRDHARSEVLKAGPNL